MLCPLQYPLHILERNLVVVGYKETLHGTTETLVKIKDSPIHVNENHVVIEKKTVEHCECKDHEDCQIDTD